jgi:dTDP-4-dehydrorhamnose reductase
MLRLAAIRAEVGVVVDQRGCPTAAGDIADALARLVPQMLGRAGASGTYHLAGAAETTWHGFAETIFVELSARGLARPRNKPIRTSEYPTAARRPMNSRLSSDKIAAEFGVRLPGFEASLPAVLDELLGAAEAKGAA